MKNVLFYQTAQSILLRWYAITGKAFLTCVVVLGLAGKTPGTAAVLTPDGFNGASWGSSPQQVQQIIKQNWQPSNENFPADLAVNVFSSQTTLAGYPATVKYYFYKQQLFQTTITFNFDELASFDFNYNVYRSVNEYYNVIRSKTLVFVRDIYDLLLKKYGKKEPVFKGLDPRFMFSRTDAYLRQERWNLRYHPYDYYQRIGAVAYARWDFPKTTVILSLNMSAPDKRFEYQLSVASVDLVRIVNREKDALRMNGL